MALASDVVVAQVSRQLPTAQGSFTVNGSKEDCAVLVKGEAATVREGNVAAVSIGKFMNPVLFDNVSMRALLTTITNHTGDSS